MWKRVVSGSAVVVLAAAGLVGVHGAAQGAGAKDPRIAVPSSARPGAVFTVRVNPRAEHGRVLLLRRAPGAPWRRVASTRITEETRTTTFKRSEATSGRYAYRAKVGTRLSRVDRIAIRAPGSGPGGGGGAGGGGGGAGGGGAGGGGAGGGGGGGTSPTPAQPELVMSVSADTLDVIAGQTYSVVAQTVRGEEPLPGRTVVVEKRIDDGAWAPFRTVTTNAKGVAQLPDSSSQPGMIFYRGTSGSLRGTTMIMVFDTVSMSATGPGLQVAQSGCAPSVSGNDDQVLLSLPNKTTDPKCQTTTGHYIEASWSLPGTCTTVRFQNLSLAGSASASISLTIDGQRMDSWALSAGGRTGPVVVNGDPMQQVVVRMQVTGGGGNVTGTLAQPDAYCA